MPILFCAYCARPLCEDSLTDKVSTGDGKPCKKSPDRKHHLERTGK